MTNCLGTCLVDGEMIDVRALHIILFSVCIVTLHDIFWIPYVLLALCECFVMCCPLSWFCGIKLVY